VSHISPCKRNEQVVLICAVVVIPVDCYRSSCLLSFVVIAKN